MTGVRLRRAGLFVVAVVALCAAWEGYKWFGDAVGGEVFGWRLPARTDDAYMPHVWDVLARLGEPERRGSSQRIGMTVLEGAWFTNAEGKTVLTKAPDADAYTNTYVEKALAELKAAGVDVNGTSFTPITVTLEPGGA